MLENAHNEPLQIERARHHRPAAFLVPQYIAGVGPSIRARRTGADALAAVGVVPFLASRFQIVSFRAVAKRCCVFMVRYRTKRGYKGSG